MAGHHQPLQQWLPLQRNSYLTHAISPFMARKEHPSESGPTN